MMEEMKIEDGIIIPNEENESENGIARIEGQEQFIFSDKRTVFEIDTTENAQGIDTSAYSEGFLLTHNELHLLSDDGYQVIPLVELHDFFGNPIVLDKTQVLELWNKSKIR
jgi:hypothetical protein